MGRRSTSTRRRKRQIMALFIRQGRRCFWCAAEMLPPGSHTSKHGQPTPPNLCTLDHLDDRLSVERGRHMGELRRVAACWRCNNLRGTASQAAQPKSELHRRSGRFPKDTEIAPATQVIVVSRRPFVVQNHCAQTQTPPGLPTGRAARKVLAIRAKLAEEAARIVAGSYHLHASNASFELPAAVCSGSETLTAAATV